MQMKIYSRLQLSSSSDVDNPIFANSLTLSAYRPKTKSTNETANNILPKNAKKWQKKLTKPLYISPPCGGAISQPIGTKFGEFVDLTEVVTLAKFGSRIFIGFSRLRAEKSIFLYRKPTVYILQCLALVIRPQLRCDLRLFCSPFNQQLCIFVWPLGPNSLIFIATW